MKLPDSFRNRVRYGYGVIITDTPSESDTTKHWSLELGLVPQRIKKGEQFIGETRKQLLEILKCTAARKPFLRFTEYSATEIYRFSTTAEPTSLIVDICCLMDMHKSVCESDAYCFRYHKDPFPPGHVPLTPIEKYLRNALDRAGLSYDCQVPVGKYLVDFVVNSKEETVIVEADGKQYHIPERDQKRDDEIFEKYGFTTLRFGGSKIVRNADKCVDEIREYFKKVKVRSRQIDKEDEDKLDPSQKAAIEHERGAARVLAPAGSGKTKVLVNRVGELVNRGVDPRGILCLTFDRKAREQLSVRLQGLGISNRRPAQRDQTVVTVATFNSLGLSILNESLVDNSRFNQFEVVDYQSKKTEFEKILMEAARRSNTRVIPLRNSNPWIPWIDSMALVKRALRSTSGPDAVTVPYLDAEREEKEIEIDEFLGKFDEICQTKGLLTFDDQIYQACRNLLIDSGSRHAIQNQFSHVLVDEYQDLNPAQIALLRLITARNYEVFCVGDDDQLIYSWRQVSTDNIVNFDQIFEGMTEYLLSVNYRSSKEVIHRSQKVIRWNPSRIKKEVVPGPTNPAGKVEVFAGSNINEQLGRMITAVRDYKTSLNARYIDIAILSRVRAHHLRIARELDKHDIPRQKILSVLLYSAPITQQLRTYLEICWDPLNASADMYKSIINKPNRYLTNKFVGQLAKSEKPYQFLLECTQPNNNDADQLPSDSSLVGEGWRNKNLKEFLRRIELIQKDFKKITPADAVDRMIGEFSFVPEVPLVEASADDADAQATIEIVREDAKSFSDIREFIDHMKWQEEAEIEGTEGLGIEPGDEEHKDYVNISTIHGAKGREWENVILFDCVDGNRNKKEQIDEEERRVFYVGMTRAKTNLFLLTRTEHPSSMIKDAFIPRELRNDPMPSRSAKEGIDALQSKVNGLKTIKMKLENELSQIPGNLEEIERLRNEIKVVRKERQEKRENLRTGGLVSRMFRNAVSEPNKMKILDGLVSQENVLESKIESLKATIRNHQSNNEEVLSVNKQIAEEEERRRRLEKIVPVLTLFDSAPSTASTPIEG